jgi:predicted amidohydrolase
MRENNTAADEMANLAMDKKRNVVRIDKLAAPDDTPDSSESPQPPVSPVSPVSPKVSPKKVADSGKAPPPLFEPAAELPRIFCVQMDIAWEDKAANFAKVAALLAGEAIAPGSMIVLPEMFATGFSFDLAVSAQGQERESEQFLAQLAARYKSTVIGGLVNVDASGKGQNQAVAFGPDGKELSRFTKLHSFSYAGEQEHFVPGRSVEVFKWNSLTASPFVCYDLRFPEVFRQAVTRGANLMLVLANWPAQREEHWLALLTARAIENQAYVAGVNRCGAGPKDSYGGASRIISPQGVILAAAGKDEIVISAPVDPPALTAYRNDFPALKDVKPPA